MKDYDVVYIDKEGDKQDYVVTSTDVRTAINNACNQQCLTIVDIGARVLPRCSTNH